MWSLEKYDRLMGRYYDIVIYFDNNKWHGKIESLNIVVAEDELDWLYQSLYDAKSKWCLEKLGHKVAW